MAIGVVTPMPGGGLRAHVTYRAHNRGTSHKRPIKKRYRSAKMNSRTKAKASKPQALVPLVPLADRLSERTLAPGVIYKYHHGGLNVNVVDIDMMNAQVEVRPVLAGESFNQLAEVKSHAQRINALAAVNANYFKSDGTPLGTLILNGEWIAGSLYDRVSLGINRAGYVRIDRVNTHGFMTTSNPNLPSLWVNSINQPRRSGCKLIVYTRRWGSYVRLPYAGTLIAVNSQGIVLDKHPREMVIPYGGCVLTDSKVSPIATLERGDNVHIDWLTNPESWSDVVQAVSGGPLLIKDGKVHIDLQSEKFRRAWTGSQIHARTAVGVTGDNHLLLATIEGPHTLWDFAKFLNALGAVEAMNLDGGGSTTMVVNGSTVTRNNNVHQRRVASSLAVIATNNHMVNHDYNRINSRLMNFYNKHDDEVPPPNISNVDGIDTRLESEAGSSETTETRISSTMVPVTAQSIP
jgi:uncharacterized protein YigE (DUF2233 family)